MLFFSGSQSAAIATLVMLLPSLVSGSPGTWSSFVSSGHHGGSSPSTYNAPPPPPPPQHYQAPTPATRPRITSWNGKNGKGRRNRNDRGSPLVFDTNHDGMISVIKGEGVAIDPSQPNIKLGAAGAGDKMLAMAAGKNGEIDGTEVFGDETFDPFSKPPKKIGAANGFEALKFIAEKAQKLNPDLKIVFSGSGKGEWVDLSQLKEALRKVGSDLGFIEGTDDTVLEPLDDVGFVSLEYVTDNNDKSQGAEFKQKGFYLDSKGEKHLVIDVWFPKKVSGVSGVINSRPMK